MIPPVQSPSTTPQIVPDVSVLHQRDLPVVCRQHVRVVDQSANVGTTSLPKYPSEALPSTTILSPPSDCDFTPPLSADRKRKRVTFAAEEDFGCDSVLSSFRYGYSSNMAAIKNRMSSSSSSEKRLCYDDDGVINETTFEDCMRGEHEERAINRSTSYLAAMPLQSVNCNIPDDTCHLSDESMTSIENASQQMALAKSLPADPRSWTRTDVHNWLLLHQMKTSSSTVSSQPLVVDVNRFRMNGKALCLMTSEMFAYRVPHGGGQRLYKDFQMRLCRAVALSLHRTCTTPVVDAPTMPLLSVTSTRPLQQQQL